MIACGFVYRRGFNRISFVAPEHFIVMNDGSTRMWKYTKNLSKGSWCSRHNMWNYIMQNTKLESLNSRPWYLFVFANYFFQSQAWGSKEGAHPPSSDLSQRCVTSRSEQTSCSAAWCLCFKRRYDVYDDNCRGAQIPGARWPARLNIGGWSIILAFLSMELASTHQRDT